MVVSNLLLPRAARDPSRFLVIGSNEGTKTAPGCTGIRSGRLHGMPQLRCSAVPGCIHILNRCSSSQSCDHSVKTTHSVKFQSALPRAGSKDIGMPAAGAASGRVAPGEYWCERWLHSVQLIWRAAGLPVPQRRTFALAWNQTQTVATYY